ncbi:MAG TPA: hypothetical protein PLO69_14575 [Gammaproteobacteria bacterium]|nr:hypothetical protein [Gammaproteobacteria bacterium]
MARNELVRYAFNRGIISPLALARVDLKRAAFSAETQENWMPRTLGPMMLRAGLGYKGASYNNNPARHVEFVRSLASMHILEFTNAILRVWTNDALVTRATVSAAVANGTFPANLGSWTDNDEVGATSAWVAGGYMGLTGNGTAAAIRDQSVAIGAYAGVEHALRVIIARGPVTIRVGSAAGLDDYIAETTLGTGTHSLSFTPSVDFNIRFMSRLERITLVDSVDVEAAGVMTLPSPYQTAALDNIRAGTDSLSVDVMFVGCVGYQPRRIERRNSGRSWSIVLYAPDDGPYRNQNVSTQTLTPSVLSGNGTLTSSVSFFKSGHVGALFRVGSTGQTVTKSMALLNDATNSIRVIGILTNRTITISLVGMTAGRTVILEYSTDEATWIAVAGQSWAADVVVGYTDGLNNQIIYYRLRCSVVGAAGATAATLSIPTGTIIGCARVTGYTSTTVVDIEVLTAFGAVTASTNWVESLWSDFRGWPSAGALYEGRMTWGGFDAIVASVSDAFDDFNPDTIGDSGPINRTIGSGPMDTINWLLPLQRLILGAQLAEHSVRSNAFDEPITPSNFNRKRCSGQGSSNVQAIAIDTHGMFVQRGGSRIFELAWDQESFDYKSTDITILNPEICKPYVKRMAMQRRPDTRVHAILSDGTASVLVYDRAEQTMCWIKITTDGDIEDVVVLPGVAGSDEDQVYYSVARTLATGTVRYLEKWAFESECQGGTLNKQADAFITGAGAVTGLPHLEGKTIVVWGDGVCPEDANGNIKTYTVTAGAAVGCPAYTSWVAGLYYEALFKSAKLGQTLSKQKNIDTMAPILYNTHPKGLWYGPDFVNMDNLPLMYEGAAVNPNVIYATYDEVAMSFPGTWSTDARLCMKAKAPRPCTVLAVVIDGQVT